MIRYVPSLVENSGPIFDPYNYNPKIPRTPSSVGKVGSVSYSYRIILRSCEFQLAELSLIVITADRMTKSLATNGTQELLMAK